MTIVLPTPALPAGPRTRLPRPSLGLLLISLVLGAAGPLGAADAPAGPDPLPALSFRLSDQFGREYTEACCVGKRSIVVVNDRESGQFGPAWGEAIRQAVGAARVPAPQWISVTLLPSVPSFLRRTAGKYLSKDPAQATLLDWEKHFARTYRIPAKHLGILVCGPDGRVLLCANVRDVDAAVVASVVAALAGSGEASGTALAAPAGSAAAPGNSSAPLEKERGK